MKVQNASRTDVFLHDVKFRRHFSVKSAVDKSWTQTARTRRRSRSPWRRICTIFQPCSCRATETELLQFRRSRIQLEKWWQPSKRGQLKNTFDKEQDHSKRFQFLTSSKSRPPSVRLNRSIPLRSHGKTQSRRQTNATAENCHQRQNPFCCQFWSETRRWPITDCHACSQEPDPCASCNQKQLCQLFSCSQEWKMPYLQCWWRSSLACKELWLQIRRRWGTSRTRSWTADPWWSCLSCQESPGFTRNCVILAFESFKIFWQFSVFFSNLCFLFSLTQLSMRALTQPF